MTASAFFRGLVLLLLLPALAQGQVTLTALRAQWEQGQYAQVLAALKRYRVQPYGRNVEVDYMIATSLCRTPGQAGLAARRFAWLLQHYSIVPNTRKAIEGEAARCARPASPGTAQPVTYNITVASVRNTGASVSSKTFYAFGLENNPLVSAPVKTLTQISAAEFEKRKVPTTQSQPADFFLRNVLEASRVVNGKPTSFCQAVYANTCRVASTAHFLVVGARAEADLLRIGAELEDYLRFYCATYSMTLPAQFFTVYVADTTPQLRSIAATQHGIETASAAIGYSFQNDLSMAAVLPPQSQGTLKHELFHLLARGNFGDIPPWLDEGMAALYEVSESAGATMRGLPNWRGRVLYEFGLNPSTGLTWRMSPSGVRSRYGQCNLPLPELLAMRWDQFDGYAENLSGHDEHSRDDSSSPEKQAYNHAMARYLALFLQQREQLPAAYAAFRALDPDAPDALRPGAERLAAALGTSVPALQQEFDAWLQTTLDEQLAAKWR